MKKFIVMYYAPMAFSEKMKDTPPEESKKEMEKWMEWAKKCGDGLVDMGAPLVNGQKVTSSGNSPSDKNVVGYSVLQADDMEKAQEMLKEHPHLSWTEGCEIEVYEAMPMPNNK